MSDQPPLDETSASAEPAKPTLAAGERVVLGDLERAEGDAIPERDRVEPFLAALLQAEHLNLLVGAGLTTGLALTAGVDAKRLPDMGSKLDVSDADLSDAVESAAIASAAGSRRGDPNIEDRIRVALVALKASVTSRTSAAASFSKLSTQRSRRSATR